MLLNCIAFRPAFRLVQFEAMLYQSSRAYAKSQTPPQYLQDEIQPYFTVKHHHGFSQYRKRHFRWSYDVTVRKEGPEEVLSRASMRRRVMRKVLDGSKHLIWGLPERYRNPRLNDSY